MSPLVRRQLCTCAHSYRHYATKASRSLIATDSLLKPVAADMIGTPDPVSNLRPVRYHVPANESEADREWRQLRERADEFNQSFWETNNTMFIKAKAEYEDSLKQKGEQVTPEALSVFYKDFLDKSYERQMEYNRAWWKLNVGMLYPGMKAAVRSLAQANSGSAASTQKGATFWEKSFES